jgi:uncharacterized repeat protein (TIGR04076 family)
MESYFKGKNIIVTGASKGIGLELSLALLRCGANVAGIARTKSRLDKIQDTAKGLPGLFLGVECDLTHRESAHSALASIIERFQSVDALINNAGIGLVGPILKTKPEEIARVMGVNFYTSVYCTEFVVPMMVENKKGMIVNVASIVAKYGLPTCGYYAAAKAALATYSQSLRTELAPVGINVLTVYPGGTDSEFQSSLMKTEGYYHRASDQKAMSSEYVAKEIMKAMVKGKTEVILGASAKILFLLKTVFPFLLQSLLVKQFNLFKWYEPKIKTTHSQKNIIDNNIQIESDLINMKQPCHYHRDKESLDQSSMLPVGMSPSLYYYLYPYLLSVTYGGDIQKNQTFKNPLDDSSAEVDQVRIKKSTPPISERGKNIVIDLLSPLKKYGKILTSPKIETKDGSFPFDLGHDRTSCPAAFRSQFPSLARHKLLEEKGVIQSAWQTSCPDHLRNLVFGKQSEAGDGAPDDSFYDSICYWGNDAKIESVIPCSKDVNSSALDGSPPIALNDVMEKLNFPCPMLLNAMYGYYVTLVNGGGLAFYTKKLDAAIAQCPSSKSRVAVEISRNDDQIDFEAIEINGSECPRGIKKGDRFSLPIDPQKNAVCLEAFNSFFLACGVAEFSKENLNVNCVMGDCNASWKITTETQPSLLV